MEEGDAGAASSADRPLTLAFGSLVGSSLLWNGSCFEQVNTLDINLLRNVNSYLKRHKAAAGDKVLKCKKCM